MNKQNCNVTRRIRKKDAQKRIGNFIKSSKLFLKTVCPTSGTCIAFGKYTDELTRYFGGFTNFDYSVAPINRIGSVSSNGFVHEIEYERDGYKAHALLKSAQEKTSDNLVYEYLVGIKYINRKVNFFPCFVQTYGLFFYDKLVGWRTFRNNARLDKSSLKHLILQNSIDYVNACKKSKYASVLIQHIHKAKSILDMKLDLNFLKKDLLNILFIIYHALSSLSTTFTHYDLHANNILLYKPMDGKCIEYHYYYSDGTKNSFLCPYVPKIIDYGRSFFDNGNVNSKKIYEKICKVPQCKPTCGKNFGFKLLGYQEPELNSYMYSSEKNESHDLRLLYFISDKVRINFKKLDTELQDIFRKTRYGVGLDGPASIYGTREDLKMEPPQIHNVTGAFLALKKAIENKRVIDENNNNYASLPKIGDLHVYSDGRPMKYERTI
jgi:hypothetical protein